MITESTKCATNVSDVMMFDGHGLGSGDGSDRTTKIDEKFLKYAHRSNLTK